MRTKRGWLALAACVVALPSAAWAGEVSTLPRPLVASSAALPASVSATVSGAFAAPGLGKRVSVTVLDAATGAPLYRKAGTLPVQPASTLKLVTALAALTVLPAGTTLDTKLVSSAAVQSGVLTGDLVVVGGGDPTLSSLETPAYPAPARLSGLVDALRRRGIRSITGRVVVDTSAYAGPATEPGWKPSYVTEGSVAPVVALMVDGGHARAAATRGSRSAAPDLLAGQRLRALLVARGIAVSGAVARGGAPTGATELAVVHSAPLPALVERMLQHSDNDVAEALLRRIALTAGRPASFAGGAAAVAATLAGLGVPTGGVVIRDGSGLSRTDRATTDLLAAVLRLATSPEHPELRPILSGLPTAGFSGTLAARYRDAATRSAAGRVRAKTGTLNNVTTLAGVVVTRSGQLVVFSASADQVPTASVGAAAKLLDRAVVRVAECGCG